MKMRLGTLAVVVAVGVLAYTVRSHPVRGGAAPEQTAPSAVKPDSERAEWETGLGDLSATDPAAFADLIKQVTWRTECALARLGFAPGPLDGTLDPQTQEAIRQFERSRKLPITGDPMSFATMKQVIADDTAMERQAVLLPAFAFVDAAWDAGRVGARGTWRTAGGAAAAFDQATAIDCDRQARRCIASTALLMDADTGHALGVSTVAYEIESWSPQEIATRPDPDHLRLRLSRSNKMVAEEQVQDGTATKRRELADGSAQYIDRFREQQKTRADLMALDAGTREWLSRRPR